MVRLAGAGKLLQSRSGAASQVASGSALAGLWGTLAGGPMTGLASAGLDFAVNYPLLKGLRLIRPPKKSTTTFTKDPSGKLVPADEYSRLEMPVNIAGMLLSSQLGSQLIPYPGEQVEPTVMSQDQTIMHQMMQRQAINDLQIPQAVAPGTQFQTAGIEFLQNYLNPNQNPMSLPVPARVQQALERTGVSLEL